MPLPTVTIDQAAGLVVIRFSGLVDLQTFIDGREAIRKVPGWSASLAHVFDFSDVSDINLSKRAIETLAGARPVFDKDSPQVLVARTDTFEFALARTFAALAQSRRNVHVVPSLEEARALVAKLRATSKS